MFPIPSAEDCVHTRHTCNDLSIIAPGPFAYGWTHPLHHFYHPNKQRVDVWYNQIKSVVWSTTTVDSVGTKKSAILAEMFSFLPNFFPSSEEAVEHTFQRFKVDKLVKQNQPNEVF